MAKGGYTPGGPRIQGNQTKPAPSGGHGRAGTDPNLGRGTAAKHASYNGGAYPGSPTPRGGHGTGSGYDGVPTGVPSKQGTVRGGRQGGRGQEGGND